MEGTVTIVGSEATYWWLGMSPMVVEGGRTATASRGLATHHHHGQWCHFTMNGAGPTHFGPFWSISIGACVKNRVGIAGSCGRPWVRREEKERERKRERNTAERERERQRGRERVDRRGRELVGTLVGISP